MEIIKKRIIYYKTIDGRFPFFEWLSSLDKKTQIIVRTRIARLRNGLRGDWKRLENSKLSELRINYGKGYRIYYRELNNVIILIVAGGDKSNQVKDIKRANDYLRDYEVRMNQ